MKFQFLTENKTTHDRILAEHGLSIYIEGGGKKILFDAGETNVFASNAEVMGVDLSQVDLAVVSHGHSDHTGGFPLFCRLNGKAPIYLHKNAYRKSHGFEDGKIEEDVCGILWTDEQKKEMEDRIHYTDGTCRITEDIVITGTIPAGEGFTPTERFYYYDENGEAVEDDMSHEQALVIREEDGLYIFSGCSHRGILNAVYEAKRLFPEEPVAAIVAGMHLYVATAEDRARVVEELKTCAVDRLYPVHCTGMDAICDLRIAFGDRCVIAEAGGTYGSQG